MKDKTELTEYKNSLPIEYEPDKNESQREKIRLYETKSRYDIFRTIGGYWRFAALVAAFAAILFLVYCIFYDGGGQKGIDADSMTANSDPFANTDEDSLVHNLEVSAPEAVAIPIIIDEARTAIDVEEYFNVPDYSGGIHKPEGIKVLVIHAHPSEKVSESMTVIDAGEVLVQILVSSGIDVTHCIALHDESGRVGAYNRMKENILKFKEEFPETVLVIDLHGSDSEAPFLFDIGVSPNYAWKENLRTVSALCSKIERNDCTVRLLPQSLGQDNGILTLNVALGFENADDMFVRELIADFSLGVISLFIENKETPRRNTGVKAYISSKSDSRIPVSAEIAEIIEGVAECSPDVLIRVTFPFA